MTNEALLADVLLKIVQRASNERPDSTGQNVKSIRVALLDQASELLARLGY